MCLGWRQAWPTTRPLSSLFPTWNILPRRPHTCSLTSFKCWPKSHLLREAFLDYTYLKSPTSLHHSLSSTLFHLCLNDIKHYLSAMLVSPSPQGQGHCFNIILSSGPRGMPYIYSKCSIKYLLVEYIINTKWCSLSLEVISIYLSAGGWDHQYWLTVEVKKLSWRQIFSPTFILWKIQTYRKVGTTAQWTLLHFLLKLTHSIRPWPHLLLLPPTNMDVFIRTGTCMCRHVDHGWVGGWTNRQTLYFG